MKLSEPLDGLTSAVGAAVLRVIARADTAFSGRRVHALAGIGSTSGGKFHPALDHRVDVPFPDQRLERAGVAPQRSGR